MICCGEGAGSPFRWMPSRTEGGLQPAHQPPINDDYAYAVFGLRGLGTERESYTSSIEGLSYTPSIEGFNRFSIEPQEPLR